MTTIVVSSRIVINTECGIRNYPRLKGRIAVKLTDPNGCSNLAPPTSRGDSIQNGARKAICYALASSSSRIIKLSNFLKFLLCSYDCSDFGL